MSSQTGPLRAQTRPLPTVNISRLTALNQSIWPGDFNGDGITDMASMSPLNPGLSDGSPQISLGNGDGTFKAPIKATTYGHVVGVGDFNKDGKLDVVTATTATDLAVYAGNGDGTLGAGHLIAELRVTNVLVADIDGDGNLDVLTLSDDGSGRIYPGNGDFTFDAPVSLITGALSLDAAIADLNGDGRKDIVVANHDSHTIAIFLNRGSFTFTSADITFDLAANDVVAADLNGDGKMDLVVAVSESHYSAGPEYHLQGFAYVLFGHGDGTFAQPVTYQTAPGAWQVVLGDFNRDGLIDIATANRSSIYRDDCAAGLKTWDSLSILPGNGDGTFAAASSFSLGNQSNLTDSRYKNTVLSLNTSDLNGDHATDLIASWGAIIINKPADPNWAPSVTAHSTQPALPNSPEVTLTAPASDSDQDTLLYSWSDSGGSPIPPIPHYCFTPGTLGVHTFTVTVDDQHGHTASSSVTVDFGSGGSDTPPIVNITAPAAGEVVAAGVPYAIRWTVTAGTQPTDRIYVSYTTDDGAQYQFVNGCSNLPPTATTCVWNDPDPPTEKARIDIVATSVNGPTGSALTDHFTIRTGGADGLPPGWADSDIGAVGATGSVNVTRGVWTVKASGADIWGTNDAFHYAWTTVDASPSAASYEITARVLSVQNVDVWTKAGLMIRDSSSPDAAHASVFVTPGRGIAFQRRDADGSTSVSTSGPPLTAPVWLKVTLGPNTIHAYYRTADSEWVLIGEDITRRPFGASTEIGLAVTSHHNGALATATFDNVSVRERSGHGEWAIGPGSGGITEENGVVWSVSDSGADIWGTADEARGMEGGDASSGISARVLGVTNTNAWTKAGVMMREDWSMAGSPHVMVVVTPGKGVAMQYRAARDQETAQLVDVPGVAPKWVRLRRDGGTYIGEISDDGIAWREIGRIGLLLADYTRGGLVVTSHDRSRTATARFDDIVQLNGADQFGIF